MFSFYGGKLIYHIIVYKTEKNSALPIAYSGIIAFSVKNTPAQQHRV